MELKAYKISIPESNFNAMSYGSTPEKALKDAVKIAFERRGLRMIKFNNREFVNPTSLVNFCKKNGLISSFVTEQKPL